VVLRVVSIACCSEHQILLTASGATSTTSPLLLQGTLSQSSSDYHATRSLGAVARKAQELLKQQRQIDQDVSRQWGDTRAAGTSWAGQVSTSTWL
jgi:hypothetical protein